MSKKTYSFGSLDKDAGKTKTWKDIQYIDPKPDPYLDNLRDYQFKTMEDLYKKHFDTNLCKEISLPYTGTPPVTTAPDTNSVLTTKTPPAKTMTAQELKDMINLLAPPQSFKSYPYYDSIWANEGSFKAAPKVTKQEKKVEVVMDDGSIESISREDLIKYIGERKIIQENEVVRKVYERYQVAVKLVRSDDNGDTGV